MCVCACVCAFVHIRVCTYTDIKRRVYSEFPAQEAYYWCDCCYCCEQALFVGLQKGLLLLVCWVAERLTIAASKNCDNDHGLQALWTGARAAHTHMNPVFVRGYANSRFPSGHHSCIRASPRRECRKCRKCRNCSPFALAYLRILALRNRAHAHTDIATDTCQVWALSFCSWGSAIIHTHVHTHTRSDRVYHHTTHLIHAHTSANRHAQN